MFSADLETRRLLVQERQALLRQEARGAPVRLPRRTEAPASGVACSADGCGSRNARRSDGLPGRGSSLLLQTFGGP